MHLGDGQHAAIGVEQGIPGLGRGRSIGLEMQECRDQLQAVADPVVDLAHQHLTLCRQGLEAIARLDDGAVRRLLLPPETDARDRGSDRGLEQFHELPADILDDVVGGAGLEGRDRDATLAGAGHEDHGRRVRQGPDGVEDVEPIAPRHVMIERHGVEAAFGQAGQPDIPIRHDLDAVAEAPELTLDEPGEAGIIVDVEQAVARHAKPARGSGSRTGTAPTAGSPRRSSDRSGAS